MSLPYRALFRLADDDEAVRVASQQFRGWLKEKSNGRHPSLTSWDWDGDGIHGVGPNALLHVVSHQGEDGSRRLMLELKETSNTGSWTTRLTAASLPSSNRLKQAMWIVTEAADDQTPKPPRLAGRILEATDVWSGDVPITAKPEMIDVTRVDELLGHIEDENRDLSIVVASPIGAPGDTWRNAVAGLMKDSVGVATAYVLDDRSFDALNDRLPPSHQIPRGSVRTFMPGLDISDPSDARRHRILGSTTMARALDRGRFASWLVERHSRAAREHLAQVALPAELQRVDNILEKLRLEQVRQVRVPIDPQPEFDGDIAAVDVSTEHPATAEAEADAKTGWLVERLASLVRRFTSRNSVDEQSIAELEGGLVQAELERSRTAEQIDELLDRRNAIASERDELRKRLEDEQLEREIAEQDRRAAESRYRAVLHWKNEHAIEGFIPEPGAPLDWEQAPDTVRELVMRFDADPQFAEVAKYVVMTDVTKAYDYADEIDERDTISRYGAAFWEYILVLRDYVLAHQSGFPGGVHDYLTADHADGRKCSTQRHKPKESEQVAANRKWREARLFAVPTDVDKSGQVYMEAHFAPTHRDQSAPRMHYYSDVDGTGKIYVGYIGRHLPNTKTN